VAIKPEQRLHPHFDTRSIISGIVDRVSGSGRRQKVRWGLLIKALPFAPFQLTENGICELGLRQIEVAPIVQKRSQPYLCAISQPCRCKLINSCESAPRKKPGWQQLLQFLKSLSRQKIQKQ